MLERTINSTARSSNVELVECLRSLFALELMAPSAELYLISPWISDMPLLSNRFGQLRAVLVEAGQDELGLAAALGVLAERGSQIRIICKPGQPSTDDFLRRLPHGIEHRMVETLHEKGLVTEHFYLRGSMNFTYSGISLNDEHVELSTNPSTVAKALTEARLRWEASTS